MRKLIIVAFLSIPTATFAQQLSPSQAAVQIDTVINNMATAFEQTAKQLQEANAKIADLQKQLDAKKDEKNVDKK